jgi:hypothetical protein
VTVRLFSPSNSATPKWKKWRSIVFGTGLGCILLTTVGLWLAKDTLTYRGVPLGMILDFLTDPIARNAYFDGDRKLLHQRLDELGFERNIKAFYRPKISDEVELDRYIHQLMYENTGYVGKAYHLGQSGQLVHNGQLPPEFKPWMQLAVKLGIAKGHTVIDGKLYIETTQGPAIPYQTLITLYSLEDLQQLAASSGLK